MRILIVEDEKGISQFLKQGLEEEAYQVVVAQDGHEGLQLGKDPDLDLILLDWMMPGMSGLDVCRQLRSEDVQTPIIFLTAKDTVPETIAGLEAGANDYIKKPFHFEELLARIKVQLRPIQEIHDQLTLGDIVLDATAHRVFRGNQEISLTQKEFALLKYLLEHKGTVCERTQIIRDVWDIHFDYNTSIIEVYINALRKKLELHKEEDAIQTIRGIGYIAREMGI
ncbi:MAG TPA: response regulator transcription factor [Saprospiraceae bacterium]|nr:response regulator transcription factor [Saprospiraceae bacterium]MCB9272078.1 response regulator transcription factor [Lewinellaceae bacterium]HPG07095.1 response regulator transcription factor [Saprospiraceae bacterium]HPQ97902.1 response regulator transcription factor [Saprospiraceae bacterium]HQU51741.1 response regulator transcription factor [Saprospiraceae bacterium]